MTSKNTINPIARLRSAVNNLDNYFSGESCDSRVQSLIVDSALWTLKWYVLVLGAIVLDAVLLLTIYASPSDWSNFARMMNAMSGLTLDTLFHREVVPFFFQKFVLAWVLRMGWVLSRIELQVEQASKVVHPKPLPDIRKAAQ